VKSKTSKIEGFIINKESVGIKISSKTMKEYKMPGERVE
jgi:hypothetical protein